jgi:sirohydrochlorin ferrochelatase
MRLKRYGVLVISHGSRSREWVRLVDEAVEAVRLPEPMPVCSAFLEVVEGRLIQDGIDRLEAEGVTDLIAVPLFVSSGSTHMDEIAYALGVQEKPLLPTDLVPFRRRASVRLCAPLDDDPEAAGIVYEKLRPLSVSPDREIVILTGHGSDEDGFRERWKEGLHRLAGRLGGLGGFAAADYATLLPDTLGGKVRDWQQRRPDCAVLIAPLFLSEGYFTGQVIPRRLEGLGYRYNGKALLPHPLLSRWLERRIAAALAEDRTTLLRTGDCKHGDESQKGEADL